MIEYSIYYKSGKWLIARIESDEYGSSYNTVLHIGCDSFFKARNTMYTNESCNFIDTIYGKSFQMDWHKVQTTKIITCWHCERSPRSRYFKTLVHLFEAYGR